MPRVSQRSLVRLMSALDAIGRANAVMIPSGGGYFRNRSADAKFWSRTLFENEFPGPLVDRIVQVYELDWDRIIKDLRSTRFFISG